MPRLWRTHCRVHFVCERKIIRRSRMKILSFQNLRVDLLRIPRGKGDVDPRLLRLSRRGASRKSAPHGPARRRVIVIGTVPKLFFTNLKLQSTKALQIKSNFDEIMFSCSRISLSRAAPHQRAHVCTAIGTRHWHGHASARAETKYNVQGKRARPEMAEK